jgi:hypothetical protein
MAMRNDGKIEFRQMTPASLKLRENIGIVA